jgi:ACR3 family arsenite transporter
VTRYGIWKVAGKEFLDKKFLPVFGPVALVGLLYTILVLFAYQGGNIVANIRPVFRVFVPLILYFTIMWSVTFFVIWHFSRRESAEHQLYGYKMAVVQAFTAASNNFVRPRAFHDIRNLNLILVSACSAYVRS